MKSLEIISLLLFSMPIFAQTPLKNPETAYMLGDYSINVLLPDKEKEWVAGGKGTAKVVPILGGTFLQEQLSTTIGNSTMNLQVSIGKDGRDNHWRLIALDKEYSGMDVYDGEEKDGSLIFSNLHSDMPFILQNGEELSFRLTYSKPIGKKHELLIEFTKDFGKTWKPYIKYVYNKAHGVSEKVTGK